MNKPEQMFYCGAILRIAFRRPQRDIVARFSESPSAARNAIRRIAPRRVACEECLNSRTYKIGQMRGVTGMVTFVKLATVPTEDKELDCPPQGPDGA